MKTVLVPQNDIDNVEQARRRLLNVLSGIEKGDIKPSNVMVYLLSLTSPLYKITHRKYKESFRSKVNRIIAKILLIGLNNFPKE